MVLLTFIQVLAYFCLFFSFSFFYFNKCFQSKFFLGNKFIVNLTCNGEFDSSNKM